MAIALLAVAWSLIPTFSGRHPTPHGQTYLYGNVPDSYDSQVYFAFIDQNAQGHVLYKNLFTSEPQKAVLFHPLWLILGGVERWSGWTAPAVYTGARAMFGLGLVMVIYLIIAHFLHSPRWRFAALAMVIFGGGFGGLILTIFYHGRQLVGLYSAWTSLHFLPVDVTLSAGFT